MFSLPPKADIAGTICMFAKRDCEHSSFLNCSPSFAHRLRRAVPKNLGSGAATGTTEAEIGRFPKELQIVCIDVCTIFNKICLGFAIQS
jgi:hypothetical protein